MMRLLIASGLFMSSLAFAETRFELVGFIKAQISKTEDRSIVVLRDSEQQKTLFLRLGDKLPGSKWVIEKMERNAVTLGDGAGDSMRLSTTESTASNEEEPTFSMNEAATPRTGFVCKAGRCLVPVDADIPGMVKPVPVVETGYSELPKAR